jgi:hypothetical protein
MLTRACKATPTRPDELDGLLGLGDSVRVGGGGWLLAEFSLGASAHSTEQEGGQHGDADRDGGAEPGSHLQAHGERLAGRAKQGCAGAGGELVGDAHRTAQGVPGGRVLASWLR